jgi:hypothetical protein
MKLLPDAVGFTEPAQYFPIQFLAKMEAEGMDVVAR